MKMILAAAAITVLMISCSTIKPLDLRAIESESGSVVTTIQSAQLTDAEKMVVNHAMNQYFEFVKKWNGFDEFTNRDKVKEFIIDFDAISKHYLLVYNVIRKHWNEYPEDSKNKLVEFETKAHNYAKIHKQLLRSEDIQEAMSLGKKFAIVALRIAGSLK